MNWSDVDQARETTFGVDNRPEGSFSTREYATRYKIQMRTAFEQLSRLVESGKLKKIKVKFGRVPTNYYIAVKSESCPTARKSKRTKKT